MPASQRLQFGPFRLDAGGRVLYRDGERVALTPKAVDVLVALVEARGRPVTKDELLQSVWAGVVVEEGSLTSHISQLRKALGEGLIETLPKRGYRFVGEVAEESQPAAVNAREARRTNLPSSLTLFIGRQQALEQVSEQLRRSRMVTLVGAGGTGKTRLSLEAAGRLVADFPDGVWLVELAQLIDATLVPRAIVAALGARAEGDTPPMALIESTLRDQRVLLLLDNCEHLLDEAAKTAQALLRALPGLVLLATSRQALGVEGETLYRVPSLTLPEPAESPMPASVIASEAAQLFVDRAIAVRPAFALTPGNAAAVAQVCRQLDGIPLAIELAAARLTALSVEEIARRLDDRFRLLTGGLRTALPRQRTLRALVDWSYDLLAPEEREVLNALSVFAGDFSLEAAENVAAHEAPAPAPVFDFIDQLVAKSLLIAQTQEGTETRYRLLETIKQYAGEKLTESGLTDAAQARHFSYFMGLAEAGANALIGPQALEWLDRLDAEHDNLRAALDRSAGDARRYAQLAGALRTFWDTRGHYTEGLARLDRALAMHASRDTVCLDVLLGAGLAAFRLAHAQRSGNLLEEAVRLAQELGDVRREAEATFWLAANFTQQGGDASEPLIVRTLALARTAGDPARELLALIELGRAAKLRGRYSEARSFLQDAVRVGTDAGCVIDTATALHYAGECALEQLDFAAARRLLNDALVLHRRVGNVHDTGSTLCLLGRLALNEDRMDEARALSSESLRIFRTLHDPKCSASTAMFHATVLNAMGDAAAALAHAQSAADAYRELDFPARRARALCLVGCAHATLGQGHAARHALFEGLLEQKRSDRDASLPELLESIAAQHPDEPVAAQLLGSAATLREQLNLPLLPVERAERERRHADVLSKHPEEAFEHAFRLGHTLTRDDAIEAALALRGSS
ncbi:winged helix-turn-helix domain-containing protein [Ramlibacter sp. WS9]|uniref:ATP-binding protein n=1 Tax=Ramlibacter sp. WS9 TaxID=1882741 RepID=UPI001142BA69|nr:winged helix-turn-helix domain-containing protein [Ramlibacter sp. WS9]